MRRPLIASFACSLAIAGCGGGESGSALDNSLGYLPANSPFVATFATDPEGSQVKALLSIVDRFPFSGQVKDQLRQSLSEENLDFEKDVRPALGNEFVVGALDAKTFSSEGDEQRVVGVIQAKDKGALDKLVEKEKAKEIGEKSGAKLYETSSEDAFAVDGDVFVIANSRADLEAALDRHAGDDHLTEEDFNKAFEGLPEDAAVRTFFDVQQLLENDPDTASARKVEWVSSLRDFGATASLQDDAVDIDFRMATEGETLEEADLPIAAGEQSPPVIDQDGEVGFGVRDPAQIFRFGETAGQATDPAAFGDYETGKRSIEQSLKIDIEKDVLSQLGGDVSGSASIDGKFGVKTKPSDPAALERTLAKVARGLPAIVGPDVRVTPPRGGQGLYTLSPSSGAPTLFGVVNGNFVVTNDSARAESLGAAPTAPVEGAAGAITLRTDAQALAARAIEAFGGTSGLGGAIGGSLFTGPLGELTGSMSAETDALTGKLRLTFD